MPRPLYTADDIKTLAKRGVRSLEVTENAIITDLAREIARDLGVGIVRSGAATQAQGASAKPSAAPASDDLAKRIHNAVAERFGDQIDAELLEAIIRRVRSAIGV